MIEKIVFSFCKYFCKEQKIEIQHSPNEYSIEFGWWLFGYWVSNGVYTICMDNDDVIDTDLIWEDTLFLDKCKRSGYLFTGRVGKARDENIGR